MRVSRVWVRVAAVPVAGLAAGALALAALGGGGWSIDDRLFVHGVPGCRWLFGWHGLVVAAIAGGGGAGLLLATCWRPNR